MLVNFVVVMVIYVQYIVSYFDIIISQELIDLVNLTFTKFIKLKPMYIVMIIVINLIKEFN